MSRTVYYLAQSLDGYIAEPDGNLDWLTGFEPRGSLAALADSKPIAGSYDAFYDGIGALAMGGETYRWVLEHLDSWPYPGRATWVFTRGDGGEGPDPAVRFVSGDVAGHHQEMLEAAGERDLWLVGGGDLASQFAAEGLIDELVVTLVPVVLGAGLATFTERLPATLVPTAIQPWDHGMVELRFDVER